MGILRRYDNPARNRYREMRAVSIKMLTLRFRQPPLLRLIQQLEKRLRATKKVHTRISE